MSYSQQTKDRLCKTFPESRYDMECELYSYIHCLGFLQLRGKGRFNLVFETENTPLAQRILILLEKLFFTAAEVAARKDNMRKDRYLYRIIVPDTKKSVEVLDRFNLLDFTGGFEFNNSINRSFFDRKTEDIGGNIKGYVKGAFLASGYIGDPKNRNYQLEFVFQKKSYAADFIEFMKYNLEIKLSLSKRRGYYVVYTKNSDTIVFIMAVIAAYTVVTDIESAKINRQVKSDASRRTNCDTANVARTVESAQRQIRAINKIIDRYGIDYLEDKLAELALIRLENPFSSLTEICEMYTPAKSKSTINNWFRKIEKIAERIQT